MQLVFAQCVGPPVPGQGIITLVPCWYVNESGTVAERYVLCALRRGADLRSAAPVTPEPQMHLSNCFVVSSQSIIDEVQFFPAQLARPLSAFLRRA